MPGTLLPIGLRSWPDGELPTVMVVCDAFLGGRKLVPKDALWPRRSTNGIVMDRGHLLLVGMRSTGKWAFPGGRNEPGEGDREAVVREVREETGVLVRAGELLAEIENYWYDHTVARAYHQRSRYLHCAPLTVALDAGLNPDREDDAERPAWVPFDHLTPDAFQGVQREVFRLLCSGASSETPRRGGAAS